MIKIDTNNIKQAGESFALLSKAYHEQIDKAIDEVIREEVNRFIREGREEIAYLSLQYHTGIRRETDA